jgi:hypothetical protein
MAKTKKNKRSSSVRSVAKSARKKKTVPRKKSVATRKDRKTGKARAQRPIRQVFKVAKFKALSIEDLDLAPDAKAAAESLVQQFGAEIVFLSGRRDSAGQARAMAPHIVDDRQWIRKTYKDPVVAGELQRWVDDHPETTTAAAIAAGLLSVMQTWDAAKLRRLSWHFSGDAFDLKRVPDPDGATIKAAIRQLPNFDSFLDKEGGRYCLASPDCMMD